MEAQQPPFLLLLVAHHQLLIKPLVSYYQQQHRSGRSNQRATSAIHDVLLPHKGIEQRTGSFTPLRSKCQGTKSVWMTGSGGKDSSFTRSRLICLIFMSFMQLLLPVPLSLSPSLAGSAVRYFLVDARSESINSGC